jgi:aliphatic nitrilase
VRFEKAAIAAPTEPYLGEPIRSGEGVVIADHDFTVIDKRKHLMDSRGPLQPSRITQSVDRPQPDRAHSRTQRAPMPAAKQGSEDILTAVE